MDMLTCREEGEDRGKGREYVGLMVDSSWFIVDGGKEMSEIKFSFGGLA